MPITKKVNKKSNPKNGEKPNNKIIKKTNVPKQKKKQLTKLKKAVEVSTVETSPAPVLVKESLVKESLVKESLVKKSQIKKPQIKKPQVKKQALKKLNNPKKKILKDAPKLKQKLKLEKDGITEESEAGTNPPKLKLELKVEKDGIKEAGTNHADKEVKLIKKEVAVVSTDPAKQEKRKQNKLKKKLKKAIAKEETSELVPGAGQTIFVGNVACNTKRVQLLKLFSPYGKIMSIRFRTANGKIIFKHKMRKESAALNAYIVFDSVEAATKALELNGTTLKNQILRVQKPGTSKNSSDSKNTIFVGNLKYSATDDKLHQIFSSCGEIEYVRTLQSADKKGCIGTAFVCFKSPDAVGLALELKGTMLDERPINVERYSVKKLEATNARSPKNNTIGKGNKKGGKPLEKAAIELKKAQKHKGKQIQGKKNQDNKTQDEKKKKSEFRGVKSEKSIKKPKKKTPSQMKRLANKIAPKD